MHGDYYGSIVNLAARLTDEAIPGELLLDAATADAAAGAADLSFEPAGQRMLKGFDEPIKTFSLLPEPPMRTLRSTAAGGASVVVAPRQSGALAGIRDQADPIPRRGRGRGCLISSCCCHRRHCMQRR